MRFTGSSASNTIQPSKETDSQIENVKPLPLSSIVLFERNKTQLCLGVLITPFNILVSSSCYHLLHPHHVSHHWENIYLNTKGKYTIKNPWLHSENSEFSIKSEERCWFTIFTFSYHVVEKFWSRNLLNAIIL